MKNGKDGPVADSVAYTSEWGAKNDGMSLQKIGTAFSAAAPTPGTAAVSALTSPASGGTTTPPSASAGGGSNWPTEPQVFADAGPDRTASVGADVLFEGKAYGLKNEPLENARYLWNFGDGVTREGAKVAHAYMYPGTYVVMLDVSSGFFSGTDRLKVAVEEARITLRRARTARGGFVEVANGSPRDLDLSLWHLRGATTTWEVPKRTIVPGGSLVAFADAVTGMGAGDVELLYPNGAAAVRLSKAIPAAVQNAPAAVAAPLRSNLAAAAEVEPVKPDISSQAAAPAAAGLSWFNRWYAGLLGVLLVGLAALFFARRPGGH